MLLVDAGNALFGAESLESQGHVIVAAYNAMGYDVINLSYRDFRRGKAATLELLQDAHFFPLSANLLDVGTGKPLFQPYVIKSVTNERIALIGVTQSPVGLAFLPHLQEQLAGIRLQPPMEALDQWLPRAKAESDRIILLYYGTVTDLLPIRERFGTALAVILVGGSRPEDLPSDLDPPSIGTSTRGRHVAHVRLASNSGAKNEVTQLAVEPTILAQQEFADLIKQVTSAGDTSHPLPGQERRASTESSESSADADTIAQPQEPREQTQQGQEGMRSSDTPSQPVNEGKTPETRKPLVIGESLHVGMSLKAAIALLEAIRKL